MPNPALLPAAIAAGSQLLGTGASAMSQGSINKKTRKWNEKMYALQRKDSLSDWSMQNEYNSPMSQMARFKEAGLNPNLIYGQGNPGNAENVRSSQMPSWSPEAPRYNLGAAGEAGVSTYYDVMQKKAIVDLTREQIQTQKSQQLLNYMSVGKGELGMEATKWYLDRSKGLYPYQLEVQKLGIDEIKNRIAKIGADTQYTNDENARKWALQQPTLKMAFQEYYNKVTTGLILEKERLIKANEAEASTYLKEMNFKKIQEINQSVQNLMKAGTGIELDNTIKEIQAGFRKKGVNIEGKQWWELALDKAMQLIGIYNR